VWLVDIFRRFWTTYRSKKDSSWTAWPLNLGPIDCPKTSESIYQSTLRNIQEERRSHLHRGGILKSRIYIYMRDLRLLYIYIYIQKLVSMQCDRKVTQPIFEYLLMAVTDSPHLDQQQMFITVTIPAQNPHKSRALLTGSHQSSFNSKSANTVFHTYKEVSLSKNTWHLILI
jgi:hypothetical protein